MLVAIEWRDVLLPQSHEATIRVLIVDDHWSVLQAYRILIDSQRPRMEVVGEALNSGEALAEARSQNPDVILLDRHIKDAVGNDVDGLDLVPALGEVTSARILILTGDEDPHLAEQAFDRGARGVVSKTAQAEVILKAVESVYKSQHWLDRSSMARLLDKARRRENLWEDPEAAKIRELTSKEREIIRRICERPASSIEEMAQQMNTSPKTFTNHLTSIYSKLDIQEPNKQWKLFIYAKKHDLDKPSK